MPEPSDQPLRRDHRGLHPEEKLARRDAILDAVARSSERMVAPEPWEALLPDMLRFLGEATKVSRVYVFEVQRHREGEPTANQRFEWCAEGVQPQIDNPDLQGVPLVSSGFGRWSELLEAGLPVFGDIGEFPESERPLLEGQQILSLLVQPIFTGPRWWGFMGFDACEQLQHWEKVEVDTLRIAAIVLGATIHQHAREAQLRETQKMEALGRMAGGVAHDFNNVLTVVSGAIQLTRMDLAASGGETPMRERNLAMAEQALSRAATLTARLLEFSKRRDGAVRLSSVLEMLRHEEPLLRQAVGGRVRLRITHQAELERLSPVRVDPTQFAQVALNLAVNARDAMPEGGELIFDISTVDAALDPARVDRVPAGRWTLLSVCDNGSGMTPEVRERIFEPFFSTKPEDRGTGLGLSTVYSIVTAAGGHVAVSSAVGKGTEFRLYFPAANA